MSLPGVHTDLPDIAGEKEVADALVRASAGRWHLWFSLQRGAGNEMDALVVAPEIGSFCIEVKNYRLDSILEYADDHLVTGSGRHLHPLRQAQLAMHGLMSHLDDQGIAPADKPRFYATAAMPRIRRSEMYAACGDDFGRHFEGMLFADDLSDPDALSRRLLRIGADAPLNPTKGRRPPRPAQVRAVTELLTRKVVLRHRPVDPAVRSAFAKIHTAARTLAAPATPTQIDRRPTADARRAALQQPGVSIRDGRSRVVFHGKPGTGKTTQLMKIALAHALAGRLTLMYCFNKVLAADLRARLASLPEFDGARDALLIADFGQLPPVLTSVPKESGFQTICVDEAQDVSQARFDELKALAADDAEWFLSDSPEQALYDERSPFLEDAVLTARANSTWERFRFNRRSGVAERLIVDAILEVSPEVERIAGWVEQHPIRTDSGPSDDEQEALDLGVAPQPRGHLPELVQLKSPSSDWWGRVEEYQQIIDDEVGSVRAGAELDLAIVTVRATGMGNELKAVKQALDNLGLSYLDQVEDGANRRRPLELGAVRIVTPHSMRGVEATRVLLLDIESMEFMPAGRRAALANIALSRARLGTKVVLRPMSAADGSYRHFVEELVAAYSASIADPTRTAG